MRMGRFTVGYKSSYTKIDPWTDHILQARQSGQQGASNLNSNYFNYAVEYTTPKFNGIEFNAHYSVLSDESNDSLHNSGKLKDFKGGDASGFGVKYSKSGLRLTADMVSINSENDPGETDASKATNGSAWHVTGQYKFDSGTTLAGHYEDASDLHLGNNIFAIVSQKIGKNGLVTASYGRNEGATDNVYGEEDSHTYNIGAKYKLTKKSALIAGYSHHERDDKDAQTITLGIDAKFGY
ncbi:MAG: porin [Hydrogenovibrio sp.]|uniref:porin n=1 Tax=Hydrogenovibrio sp. TaxID=2065821 RepID=UPI0028704E22|nr:porin [Hydrogenovibrio sp.]MDR9498991.1 porin [Hydrogenovibrio sp.]